MLFRSLRHYAKLSSSTASSPTLTDISLSQLVFRTRDGNTHVIPFQPPMKSFSEARVRTVEMDRESRAALDLSSIRVTEFDLPYGAYQWGVISTIAFAFAVYFNLGLIVPGTFVYDTLLPYWPGGPSWFFWFVDKLPYIVFGIHAGEAAWLDQTRLRKYNVTRGSGLWWKWIGSAVAEGGGAILRFDAIVTRKKAEETKRQH